MKVSQWMGRRPRATSIIGAIAIVVVGSAILARGAHAEESKPGAVASETTAKSGSSPAPAPLFEPPKTYSAKVYQSGTDHKKLLFTNDHVSVPTAKGYTFTNTYKDTDGNVVAVETTDVIRDGDQFRVHLYKISQKQTSAEGSVEVKDGRAYFSYTKDGKTRKSDEAVGDDFVCGPTLLAYLHHRYDKILAGERVKARFIVLDRLETVGFEYFKEKDMEYKGQKAMMVKMKPSSFVVAAIVDPLHFIVPMDGTRVWEVDGRTQLKYKVGDKLTDLDADTVYEY